ncbi:MAG: T9SS type A sorting domain-containing protein [Aureispira sp.]
MSGVELQAQNCPTSIAGQLSNVRGMVVVTDTTPTPVYTVMPTGLPNTEFFILRQDTIAADGFGPPIITSSLDGRIVPSDFGFGACQELCVIPFSYNLSQVQLVVDSLLNGIYLGSTTCCTAAGTFFVGLCDSLNNRGISSGADIQNLNDVIAFTDVFANTGGDAPSLPQLIATISQLNNFIGLFGNCSAGVASICYQVSPLPTAMDCYQVVLPNAATLILASPDTLVTVTSGSYQLFASYLPNSSTESIVWSVGQPDLGCTVNTMGMLQTSTSPGTVWLIATGTRGCQADSVLVQVSAPIGIHRIHDNQLTIKASPIPFKQQLSVELEVAAGNYQLQLLDALGRVVYTANKILDAGQHQWSLPTHQLSRGSYILHIKSEKKQGILTVIK